MTLTSFAILAAWCFTWAGSDDFADLPWARAGLWLYGSLGVAFAVWLSTVLILVVARGKTLNPHHRVRRMMIELNDWRTTLSAMFAPAVGDAARERGRSRGLAGENLEALVEAAQLRTACADWERGVRPPGSPAGAQNEETTRDGTGSIDAEVVWWLRVARALKSETALPQCPARDHTPAAC